MLERSVLIDDDIYQYHEITLIKHAIKQYTSITVKSYKTNPNYDISTMSKNNEFKIPFNDTLTFVGAEKYISNIDFFKEYIDPKTMLLEELAPTLTDEQATAVITIYPEWLPTEEYQTNDRVRYSNGFYKCIQSHQAQIDWYPANVPSLWAPIIDASILPIGTYPLWQQPNSTNPYMLDDKVTYKNVVWISIIDNNVWAPDIYGWNIYISDGEDESEIDIPTPDEPTPDEPTPDEPTPDEPTPDEPDTPTPDIPDEPTPDEPTVPEWQQPDSTNAYMIGDRVTFNGKIYESLIDNNIWSPTDYPQGWAEIN